MRRFIALVSLLLLSLSHADATTQVHARATASVAKPTREMIAAAPSIRLAAIVERELSPRGPARLLAPWHPGRWESRFALLFPMRVENLVQRLRILTCIRHAASPVIARTIRNSRDAGSLLAILADPARKRLHTERMKLPRLHQEKKQ